MKITSRVRYGVDAMLALAYHYDEGPIMLSDIAATQEISRKYLHALLTALKSTGLVRSIRGRGGGYSLTRAPGEITISEVIESLEGSLTVVERGGGTGTRGPMAAVTDELWQNLGRMMEKHLSQITLEDLVGRMKAREERPPMYYI